MIMQDKYSNLKINILLICFILVFFIYAFILSISKQDTISKHNLFITNGSDLVNYSETNGIIKIGNDDNVNNYYLIIGDNKVDVRNYNLLAYGLARNNNVVYLNQFLFNLNKLNIDLAQDIIDTVNNINIIAIGQGYDRAIQLINNNKDKIDSLILINQQLKDDIDINVIEILDNSYDIEGNNIINLDYLINYNELSNNTNDVYQLDIANKVLGIDESVCGFINDIIIQLETYPNNSINNIINDGCNVISLNTSSNYNLDKLKDKFKYNPDIVYIEKQDNTDNITELAQKYNIDINWLDSE